MVLAIAVLCGNSWASELHTQQDIGDGDAFKRNDSQHLAADEAVRTAKRWIEAGQPQEALTVLRIVSFDCEINLLSPVFFRGLKFPKVVR